MSTPVRAMSPISFSLHNADQQPVLDILDSSEGQDLTLEIANRSGQDLRLTGIGQGIAGPDRYHFELRFRPGVLNNAPGITLDAADGWRICSLPQKDGTVSLYLWGSGGDTLAAGQPIALRLRRVNADGGGGARGTKVELRYQNLEYAPGDRAQNPEPLAEGYRVQYLSIVNQRGRKYIPLHVGFIGSNTILNDGKTANDRVLSITNTLKGEKLLLSANPPSRFTLYFDVYDPEEQNDWALGTGSAVKNIEVDAVQKNELTPEQMQARLKKALESLLQQLSQEQQIQEQQNLAALKSDSERVNYLVDKFRVHIESDKLVTLDEWIVEKNDQGTTVEWTITPAKDKSFLDEGESLCLRIGNVVSAMRSGPANVYLRYENIPGYWDGQFVASLEKTHLVQRDQLNADESYTQESYVGIGTNDPHTSLVIKKSAEGALGPVLTLQNDGGHAGAGGAFDFNGYDVGANDASARIRSLDDGYYSSHLAFYTKEPGAVDKHLQERLRISSDGNVGIGTDSPTSKLHINGGSRFDGNVGIGKMPDATVKLDVAGDMRIDSHCQINLADENHALRYGGGDFKLADQKIDGPILYGFEGGCLGSHHGTENQKTALRWNRDGNVGIGTNDPTERLDVRSSKADAEVNLRVANSDATGFINLYPGRTGDLNPSIIWPTNQPLRFATASSINNSAALDWSEKVRITGDGNVGIGTTTPQAKLEVVGDLKVTGSITIGDWKLEARQDNAWNSQNTALYLSWKGRDAARFGTVRDMLQVSIYDGDGRKLGYFYMNDGGDIDRFL